MRFESAENAWTQLYSDLFSAGYAYRPDVVIYKKTEHQHKADDRRFIKTCEGGEVLSAIAHLPPAHKAWGMWTYTDDGDENTRSDWEALIMHWLIGELDRKKVKVPGSWGKTSKLQSMMLLVMKDYRQQKMNGGKLYTKRQLALKLGIDPAQFCPGRMWARYLSHILAALALLNDETLTPVKAVLDDMELKSWQMPRTA